MSVWFVYLVRCRDRSLYCGITNDVAKRMRAHNEGRGARYTRGRGPVRVVFLETYGSKSEALRREAALKRLRTEAKRQLVRASAR